jgi:hypothetical protein
MGRIILLLGLSVALATGAKAEPDIQSANYRLPACKAFIQNERAPPFTQGICVGLVSGIAWTIGGGNLTGACARIPNEVTVRQEIQVVVRDLIASMSFSTDLSLRHWLTPGHAGMQNWYPTPRR